MLIVELLIAVAAIVAAIYFWRKSGGLEVALSEKDLEIARLNAEINTMTAEINRLKLEMSILDPYGVIVDSEKKAREILEDAKSKLDAAILDQNRIVVDAENIAQKILEDAKTQLREARMTAAEMQSNASQKLAETGREADCIIATALRKAEEVAAETQNNALWNAQSQIEQASRKLVEAGREADRIIATATRRAEEVAGDALKAMQNAVVYENTVKAMKNVVEGYGDQYITPTYSLLDELADEFGFTDAGVELKAARDRTRDMVKTGRAASCDYVEPHRKETAIRFVVDAFNGKVASILSRRKATNIGTLQQAINDAFNLVNHNGSAFRSARINQKFLEARLDELKWAIIVQELKERDKEEQRRIKEQIREEERAVWEFEKAIRDAEKEEDALRKAMDKIRKAVERATEEQKIVYEAQIVVLHEKLREIEERRQRAMSMAQQTRAGHVYIISNIGSFGDDVFKIGMTRRLEPLDRVRELGNASVPFVFDIHAMIYSDDAPNLERKLQKSFLKSQVNKVNPRKEFFKVSLADIRGKVEQLGVETYWTIAAAAKDYRESLAIERAMAENPEIQRDWLRHQIVAVDEIAESIESEDYALSYPSQ